MVTKSLVETGEHCPLVETIKIEDVEPDDFVWLPRKGWQEELPRHVLEVRVDAQFVHLNCAENTTLAAPSGYRVVRWAR